MLLAIYALSPFKMYAPYLSYQLNYKYIAGVLCVNKEKPRMACNGKCHLKKELKKSSEEETKNNNQLKRIFQEEIAFMDMFSVADKPYIISNDIRFFYVEKYFSSALEHFTPPPKG